MKELTVNLPEKSYNIQISGDILSKSEEIIKQIFPKGKAVIITDKNVWDIYGNDFLQSFKNKPDYIILPAGEQTKSLATAETVFENLSELGLLRDGLLIALGGGVIGDLTGFVASAYLRGIPFVQIPTTLLAQVDSSVGGKTGVNIRTGKNLVGSFYQPSAVISDVNVLNTLPEREFACGMAEIIKYCMIWKGPLRELLKDYNPTNTETSEKLEEIIHECCNIKRQVVELDRFDTGLRMILNFGHTFGHAIENYYSYTKYNHGEAVALGMVLACNLGIMLGITPEAAKAELMDYLHRFNLPVSDPVNVTDLIAAVFNDKKNTSDGINFVLINKENRAVIHKINFDELNSSAKELTF